MAIQKKNTPSEAELEILNVLWSNGKLTIREIHDYLSQSKEVGYTTTLKQVQRMLDKAMVQREGAGKSHFYTAILKEKEVKNTLINRLLNNAFGGSAMKMVMHALGQSEATPEEIEKLESFLKDQKKKA